MPLTTEGPFVPASVDYLEAFAKAGVTYYCPSSFKSTLVLLDSIRPVCILNTCMGGLMRSPMANDIMKYHGHNIATLTQEAALERGYKSTAISQLSFIQALFDKGNFENDLLHLSGSLDKGFDCICWYNNGERDVYGKRLVEAFATHLKALRQNSAQTSNLTFIEINASERQIERYLPDGKTCANYL